MLPIGDFRKQYFLVNLILVLVFSATCQQYISYFVVSGFRKNHDIWMYQVHVCTPNNGGWKSNTQTLVVVGTDCIIRLRTKSDHVYALHNAGLCTRYAKDLVLITTPAKSFVYEYGMPCMFKCSEICVLCGKWSRYFQVVRSIERRKPITIISSLSYRFAASSK
jgi:hypothetical protein